MAYTIQSPSEGIYTFTTDDHRLYKMNISENSHYFISNCTNCKKIYEFSLDCNKRGCADPKIENTVVAFILDFISKNCHGIYYRTENSDGKGKAREELFEKWFTRCEEEDKNLHFEKSVNEFIYLNGSMKYMVARYHLLVDTRCVNVDDLMNMHHYECVPCKEKNDECE